MFTEHTASLASNIRLQRANSTLLPSLHLYRGPISNNTSLPRLGRCWWCHTIEFVQVTSLCSISPGLRCESNRPKPPRPSILSTGEHPLLAVLLCGQFLRSSFEPSFPARQVLAAAFHVLLLEGKSLDLWVSVNNRCVRSSNVELCRRQPISSSLLFSRSISSGLTASCPGFASSYLKYLTK
jgi:hypothetical protein